MQETKKLKQQIARKDSQIRELERQLECSFMANEEALVRYTNAQANWKSEKDELQSKLSSVEAQLNSTKQDLLFAKQDNEIYANDSEKLRKIIAKLKKENRMNSHLNQDEARMMMSSQSQ